MPAETNDTEFYLTGMSLLAALSYHGFNNIQINFTSLGSRMK